MRAGSAGSGATRPRPGGRRIRLRPSGPGARGAKRPSVAKYTAKTSTFRCQASAPKATMPVSVIAVQASARPAMREGTEASGKMTSSQTKRSRSAAAGQTRPGPGTAIRARDPGRPVGGAPARRPRRRACARGRARATYCPRRPPPGRAPPTRSSRRGWARDSSWGAGRRGDPPRSPGRTARARRAGRPRAEPREESAQWNDAPGAGGRARRRAGGERGGGEGQRHRERRAGHEVDERQREVVALTRAMRSRRSARPARGGGGEERERPRAYRFGTSSERGRDATSRSWRAPFRGRYPGNGGGMMSPP